VLLLLLLLRVGEERAGRDGRGVGVGRLLLLLLLGERAWLGEVGPGRWAGVRRRRRLRCCRRG